MEIKLFDSELKVMEALWNNGKQTAGQLAILLKEETGWNRNTTYTVIKKCIDKGAVKRTDPGFHCEALITKEEIQQYETNELIEKMFDGSSEKFFASFLEGRGLSDEEVNKLKRLIDTER